jgi:hypothetical protein
LIVAPKKETIALAHQLAERVGQGDRERMIEFIETVLLYKFPQMSREEVEAMFTLGDLKKTRGCAPVPALDFYDRRHSSTQYQYYPKSVRCCPALPHAFGVLWKF